MRTPSADSAHRAGELALLTTAFVLPLAFSLRTYDSAQIKFAVVQWGALTLAFSWLWQGIARGRFAAPASAWPALAPALAFGALLVGRFAAAPHKVAAFPGFTTQATMLAAFLASFLGFAGARTAARFAALVVAAAWVVSAYAVLQALGVDPFVWKAAWGAGAVGTRAFSTLGNPYLCASFLGVAVPVALVLAADPEAPAPLKAAALALLPAAAATTALTGSVVGAAALAASCGVFAVLWAGASRTPAALKSAVLAVLVGASALGATVLASAPGARRESWSYASEYRELAAAAEARMVAERPLLGFGPGSFPTEYPRFRPKEIVALEGTNHNTMTDHPELPLLGVAVELGLLGAALWVWMFAAALWTGLKGAGDLRRAGAFAESSYAGGFAAAAAGALVSAHFGWAGDTPAPGWYAWPLAGLAAGLAQLAARRAPVSVYPLPVSESVRRALYAPCLAAFAAASLAPAAWLRSGVELNYGVYLAKQGDYKGAVARLENVLPGGHDWTMAQYFKGNALLDDGRPQEALAAWDRLQEQAPDYVLVHAQRGAALARLGDWKGAASERGKQAELDPLYLENLVAWSEAARAAGDLGTARRAAEMAVALAPDDAGARTQVAANLLMERRLAEKSGKPGGKGLAKKPKP